MVEFTVSSEEKTEELVEERRSSSGEDWED